MYSLKNFFTKTPIQIATAVTTILNVLVILGPLNLDGKAVSAINVAVAVVLALFVSSQTANKAVLNELRDAIPTVTLDETSYPSPEERGPHRATTYVTKDDEGGYTTLTPLAYAIIGAVLVITVLWFGDAVHWWTLMHG